MADINKHLESVLIESELQYCFVWKTKYSHKALVREIGLRLRDLIRETCDVYGISIIEGNIRPDHVRIVIKAPSHLLPPKIAQYLKGRSANMLMKEFPDLKKQYSGGHLWARGYFCDRAESVEEEAIKKYIEYSLR